MNNMKYSDTNTVNKFLYEIQSFFFFLCSYTIGTTDPYAKRK